MARLNAKGPVVPVASNHNQHEERVVEESNWEQFVYTQQLRADSVRAEDQGETQFSLLLREQLGAGQDPEEEDEDEDEEDVSANVLKVLNNATSTPRASSRAFEEDEPQNNPPSIGKRISGIFSGMRFLGSSSAANADDNTEDETIPTEARDDTMQPPATTTSARKVPKKLSRPSVLHQPLNTYQPQPQSSGKPDVYIVNESPEKAASTPTGTQSRQSQGVKRKRNDHVASKKPPPTGKPTSPGLLETASNELDEIQLEAPIRVTRSRGSGKIVEPIDYSRNVERTVKRKRASDDNPPSKESRKRRKTVVEDEANELEDGDRSGSPREQNRAEEATSPPILQRTYSEDELPETSDKESQSGAASGQSDATTGRTKKSKNATVEDKEDFDDQSFQDGGGGVGDGENEDHVESEGEEMASTNAAKTRKEHQGEQRLRKGPPYFGDDFIADSNIEKIMEQVERLGMNDPVELEKAYTNPGREIQVLTRSIISSYESIQGLDEHDDPDPAARTEALCSAVRDLDRLEVAVRGVIGNLCDPAKLAAGDKHGGVVWRKKMMKDLFLFVMPDIIRAASAAILTYGSEGPPSTLDLNEILRYLSLASKLLLLVEDSHNKDLRPQAAHNAAPIRGPYVRIKTLLRGFEMQCKQELRYREKVIEGKRQQKERREREEADRLADEEAQIEFQRRQEQINDEYNQARMNYGLPPVPLAGSQVSRNMESSEPPQPSQSQQMQELNITAHRRRAEQEVEALKKKLEAAERRVAKLRREEQRQLNGYDADDTHEADYERVEMFPGGNNHAPPTEPWTETEYEVLADGLKLEKGPDKYPNIARRLDRSLDEIFEKALEFKRVMIEVYIRDGAPVEPWIEIIGNEMPRARE
ncbi:hypothetical protein V493_04501 [Pseudogymnoascus sp. VKM F-4281 (FW-2241)]|nr:hypothetical protein V493_04501 [Pseudogymnoascus sp. VKM F-4281 (FW-2241)]